MTHAKIIPCLRYADAPAAIDFLCAAFGFEKHSVYADDKDPSLIHHAQLVRGTSMIMLSSAIEGEWTAAAAMKTVAEVGGNTQTVYIIVEDADAHCTTARNAGARIIREPTDEDYGGRGYGALDPEGIAWGFGTYDPWAQPSSAEGDLA